MIGGKSKISQREVRQPLGGGQPTIWPMFPENKEIVDAEGEAVVASSALPLRSATDDCNVMAAQKSDRN